MRGFLTNSACDGRAPKQARARRRFVRPRLMKKMMVERQVARFLVAPSGFGKTSLAVEYADSIFGFRNVYWIDCQSPCFLRDLDEGIVSSTLEAVGARGSLAVFEDVPYLDDERSDAFSADVDSLLGCGWEVVVTTLPPYDSLSERQADRTCVTARDFLVDDSEIASADDAPFARGIAPRERVCALAWGDEAQRAAFEETLKVPELPAEMRLAVFAMLILREGTFEELGMFARGMKRDTRRFLAENYPYLGMDLVEESFSALDVPVRRLGKIFGDSADAMACNAGSAGRDTLISHMAEALVGKADHRRACELMKSLCSRKRRLAWIEEQQGAFVASGQIIPMQDLFESLGSHPSGLTPAVLLGAAVRLRLLGDAAQAAKVGARAMSHADSTLAQGCAAALLCEECGADECRERARGILGRIAQRVEGNGDRALRMLARVAASRLAVESDPFAAVDIMRPCEEALPGSAIGMGHLAFLLRCASGRLSRDGAAWSREERAAVADLGLRCVALCRSNPVPNLFEALVRDALAGLVGEVGGNDGKSRVADGIALSLAAQREEWKARRGRCECISTSGAAFPPESAFARVPEMRIRLFGGMEVRVGGRVIDPSRFAKQRAKTLLAVLALHRGREVPRRELLDIMWPASPADRAVNNFYSLWSVLRKALSDEQGECPYLVRHRASCMVDARFVRSDADDFEEVYWKLMFDAPDPRDWAATFERLSRDFACDLLPSESDNAYILGLRESYRRRLTDACVAAANRLCDIREPHVSLFFARAALELDRSREDAYCTLMRSQMMAGQRTLAMETYFSCLSYLGEELGVGPSACLSRLYGELLASADDDSLTR